MDEKTARAVSAVAVRTNRPVLFVAPETLQTVGTTGQYNTQTKQNSSGNTQVYQAAGRYTSDGTVEISATLTTDEAVDFVLKHELTHAIEGSGTYSRLKELVRKQMGAEAYAAAVQQAEQTRSRQGDTKGAQNAESEVVADWIGENLYRDGFARMIQNLDGGMAVQFRTILDGVQRAFGLTKNARQAATIRAAERAFAEALESDYSSASENTAAEAGDGGGYAYIGEAKDGRAMYESGMPDSMSTDEILREFKQRIASVFNLGQVQLKTDTKRIQVLGDKYTQTKNLYGDKNASNTERRAKGKLLYDYADILEGATYVGRPRSEEIEPSYADHLQKPKNAAHKDVKYWYKFKNSIYLDGVGYDIVFNIRDKGKEQYQYLIEIKENGRRSAIQPQRSLGRTLPTSTDTRISQETPGVNTQSMQNSEENSSDGQKSYLPTDMQERERAAATQKAENTRRLAEQQQQQEQAETAEELRRKNEALQKKVEKLRQQTHRTTEKTVREEDVQKLTRKILKEYSSTLKFGEILEAVQALGDTIVQGGQLSYDELHREALSIARKIVNRSETLIDDGYSATYEDIRQYLRDNKVSIREEDKSDIADYEAFRRRNQRRLNLSKDGTPVDVLYGEMQETTDEAIAYEEMVADACQTMLLDSNAVEKLVQLRQQDKGLFEKIKEFIHNILDKLRKEYAGIDPNSDEARALRSMTDVVEQMSALFEDAAVDAAQAHSQAAETVGAETDIRHSFRNTKSGMANDSLKPYSAELTDIITGNGDLIVDNFDALLNIVDLAFDEPTKKATAYFGNLDESILEKIKSSIPKFEMNPKDWTKIKY